MEPRYKKGGHPCAFPSPVAVMEMQPLFQCRVLYLLSFAVLCIVFVVCLFCFIFVYLCIYCIIIIII